MPTGHVAHAAGTVRGSPVPGVVEYISYWPGDSASKGKNAIKAQAGHWNDQPIQDGVSEMNRLTALRLEVGYRQQNGIPIPDHWNEALASLGKGPINDPRPGQKPTDL